jgi:hypothetical protein
MDWMRRLFAFSIAKAWWFARARPSRRRRLSPANWRKRQLVVASYWRPNAHQRLGQPHARYPPVSRRFLWLTLTHVG